LTTRKLLSRHQIRARLTSFTEHNRRAKIPVILDALETGDVALVSEAGTPVISDPGLELVAAAGEAGFDVVPIPGPSAITAALAVSGLPARQFTYVGFLPRRRGERRRLLEPLADEGRTIVAFESPYRLQRSLADALSILGDADIVVCRELTKAFEEVFRGRISEALAHFEHPRGEFTLVIAARGKGDKLRPEAASPPEPVPEPRRRRFR
jgi:16S rRNA (cytidine1402-2'-O)-methyltransferase